MTYSNTEGTIVGSVCVRLFLFSFHWTLAFAENKPYNVLVSLVSSLVDLHRPPDSGSLYFQCITKLEIKHYIMTLQSNTEHRVSQF